PAQRLYTKRISPFVPHLPPRPYHRKVLGYRIISLLLLAPLVEGGAASGMCLLESRGFAPDPFVRRLPRRHRVIDQREVQEGGLYAAAPDSDRRPDPVAE
ncbi:hypothetical protein FZEAL_8698, partial [Fusarium zealandicum]